MNPVKKNSFNRKGTLENLLENVEFARE